MIPTAGTAKLEYLAWPMYQYRELPFFWACPHGNGSRNLQVLTFYLSISPQRLILNVIAQMTEGENALIVSDQQDALTAFLKR